MIRSFDIKNPTKTHISWMAEVASLKKPRKFEFTPGLNILWGRNGSGKSTVLKAMARLLHCEQSGVPVVTETSIREMFDNIRGEDHKDLKASMVLDHDGQAVRFFDPSIAVGLMGGGAAFDDDFFHQGLNNLRFRGSAGQTTTFRFDAIATSIIKDEVPTVERRLRADRVNDFWVARLRTADHFLKGSGKAGPLTILLDEPERSYDFAHQVGCWRFIRAMAKKYQILVASHSFFAVNIPEANYIELEDGYLEIAKRALALLPGWADEKPDPKDYEPEAQAEKKTKKKR